VKEERAELTVRVFTDSGADLPPDLAQSLDIHVVPLTIHFGERLYKDGVDLPPAAFYEELKRSAEPPNTSQPSPGEFLAAYREHSAPRDVILSFHLSSKMSGTYQSAVLAARSLEDREAHVVDTGMASLGIALPAIYAARWAAEGIAPADILERCRQLLAGMRVYFLVGTLEYLQRHGRIGRAQALLGSLLNIKPVLAIEDGMVTGADKVRGTKKAVARLLELSFSHLQSDGRYAAAVVDAEEPDIAATLTAAVQQQIPDVDFYRGQLGATIGTHAGPGTVGLILARLP
jgi:DegV family protein with EDD domain